MKYGLVWLLVMILTFLSLATGVATERDILAPRVPEEEREAARKMKNPLPPTPENIARGKVLFEGKASCFICHGTGGKGEGRAGVLLEPTPRNFTNPKFHELRADGELFWVIKNGVAGTGMLPMIPIVISGHEAWHVILYERSLGKR